MMKRHSPRHHQSHPHPVYFTGGRTLEKLRKIEKEIFIYVFSPISLLQYFSKRILKVDA